MADLMHIAAACPGCEAEDALEWSVYAGAGWGPQLVPLSFFKGGRLLVRCCLNCGHLGWRATDDTLQALRDQAKALPLTPPAGTIDPPS